MRSRLILGVCAGVLLLHGALGCAEFGEVGGASPRLASGERGASVVSNSTDGPSQVPGASGAGGAGSGDGSGGSDGASNVDLSGSSDGLAAGSDTEVGQGAGGASGSDTTNPAAAAATAGGDGDAEQGTGEGDATGNATQAPPVQAGICNEQNVERACYPFATATYGLGACTAGVQMCSTGEFPQWSECSGSTGPSPEVCNGIDDNCDGRTDELGSESCGLGECRTTVDLCVAGQPNDCTPLDVASEEICDALDNDCDGATDEGVGDGLTLRCGEGVCDHTVEACIDGLMPQCDPFEGAVVEVCNELDDDCDGSIDEGVWNACGECGPLPTESCNSTDDDCDGLVDEGCACDAATNVGSSDLIHEPVDLVLLVDNSSSMNDEIGWVQTQLQGFADDLANRGLDMRVIILSSRGTGTREICIAPPLGGANCRDNPPDFYHIDESISSTLGWHELVDRAQDWQPLLRPDAQLHVALISDDDERWSVSEFWEEWNEISPSLSMPTYHAVVATEDCDEAASIGTNHMALVEETSGVLQNLCDQDIGLALSAIADGIDTVTIPCDWPLPPAPVGGVLDQNGLMVIVNTGLGMSTTLNQLANAGTCGAGNGFSRSGDTVNLCPATCADLQGESDATVEIRLPCTLSGE